MKQPSVSIIVPVYNVEPYVEDCIRSVIHQTYAGPMECIIVDDCGTDNSMAVVERLVAEYNGPISFKILHHEHNRGLSAARNSGMDAATGDYLFFLDSDDEITADCMETLVEPFEEEWYDVVVSNANGFEKDSSNQWHKNKFWVLNISGDTLLKDKYKLTTFGKKWKWSAWNKLYRSSFIHDYHLQFKEGLLYEDMLWGFMIACNASSIYLRNKDTYIYKLREGSISHPFDIKVRIKALKVIIKEMGEYIFNHDVNITSAFPIFDKFKDEVLDYYSYSYSSFASIYHQLYPPFNIKWWNIILANHRHLKQDIYDLHYLLPISIAPGWQYWLCKITNKLNRVTGFEYLRRRQFREYLRFIRHGIHSTCHFTTKGNRDFEEPSMLLDITKLRIAVYTCIVGHYDNIIEPIYVEPGIDYYVFTDIECPMNSVWKKIDITQFEEYSQLSPAELNRKIKMLPFNYLPDYDYSVYVDGHVEILSAISPTIAEMGDCALGVHYHRKRDCIYDETTRIAFLRKADMTTVNEQIREYKEDGFPRHYGLYENTVLIRNHHDEGIRHLMGIWWEVYQKYPTRDQLSLPYIIWKTNFDRTKIHIIGNNINKSTIFKRANFHHGNKL